MLYKSKWANARYLIGLIILGLSCQCIHAVEKDSVIFEMRTYTTFEGKLEALNSRFRDHTLKLFVKHDMKSIGYWIPSDKPNTLIYILAHGSKSKAGESWKNFIADPEWKKAYADSIVNGKLVKNIESVFMNATDYSSIR